MIRGVSFEGEPGCALWIRSCARWSRYPDLGQGNSEREKSLVVLLTGKRLGKLESLMSEDRKGYVQNTAVPLFVLFFRAWYYPVQACGGSAATKWLLAGSWASAWQGQGPAGPGASRPGASRVPKRSWGPCPTWLPAPLSHSTRSCSVPGGMWNLGMVCEGGECFSLRPVRSLGPSRCGMSPLPVWDRSGFCPLFTAWCAAFSWQGHSRGTKHQNFGFCWPWACCVCVPQRTTTLENPSRKAPEAGH